jgi:hypothetical protein
LRSCSTIHEENCAKFKWFPFKLNIMLDDVTFAHQVEPGVIPPEVELTARPADNPACDDMSEDLKPVLARQMEV